MTLPRFNGIAAVLFDLDGTLADTAPDLAGAANAMRIERGLPALPLSRLRPVASQGARGLLREALGKVPGDADYELLREEFLSRYEARLCEESQLFEDMAAVIQALAERGLRWGIVTNKARRFTEPLIELLKVTPAPGVVVSGDTTAHIKPHPAPLLHAALQLGIAPAHAIYVGDDERDIAAGRAAGMGTVAAAYGYCAHSAPESWKADALILRPLELLTLL